MRKTKIFGIGLQRTGTTSLFEALNTLGIRSAPHGIPLYYDINDPILHKYDAFMDNPIPLLYKQLDQQIPGSKFILTLRDEESWLRSTAWLFNTRLNEMDNRLKAIADEIHEKFYGTIQFNEDVFKRKRREYHEEVNHYFSERPGDLLKIDITKGTSWKPICEFLHLPIPNKEFPWLNKSR